MSSIYFGADDPLSDPDWESFAGPLRGRPDFEDRIVAERARRQRAADVINYALIAGLEMPCDDQVAELKVMGEFVAAAYGWVGHPRALLIQAAEVESRLLLRAAATRDIPEFANIALATGAWRHAYVEWGLSRGVEGFRSQLGESDGGTAAHV